MNAGVSKVMMTLGVALTMSLSVNATDLSEDAVNKRIAPIGKVYLAGAQPAAPAKPAGPRTAADIYQTTCFACHGTGAAGAPKKGDKAAWAPRVAQGIDKMFDHAWKGFTGSTGVMPAKGTCMNCSEDEIKATIKFMTEGM
ncbi:c-type cytochrome [Psychrobium sp. MM17-31]|uniref:c-type cytochrome n=1 Tax=Psychrobium sp. MM17-31 TaxID=2917758 RepID=UPI0031BAEFCB